MTDNGRLLRMSGCPNRSYYWRIFFQGVRSQVHINMGEGGGGGWGGQVLEVFGEGLKER